jgi:hypothetical protein
MSQLLNCSENIFAGVHAVYSLGSQVQLDGIDVVGSYREPGFECWLPSAAEGACIACDDSTKPSPRIRINESLATQRYEECLSVGKVSVFKKKSLRGRQ